MLTRIVHNNENLCTFVDSLNLPLSKPQRRHVLNVADGLLVAEGPSTLAEIHRQFVDTVDPSNIADTFRIAPWSAEDILGPLQAHVVQAVVEQLKISDIKPVLLVNLDDSLAIKDPDTRHLEGVDYHFDSAAKRRKRTKLQNGLCYVICTLVVGDWSVTFAVCPYLREKTVRRLNRKRAPDQRLHFASKYHVAQRILERLRALLPRWVRVYVQFDAWYASARLLKYIRRQGWHAICRVRENRHLNHQRMDQRFLAQRHRRYARVSITAADGTSTTYLLRQEVGRLNDVPFDVRGLESRRHYRDKHPAYFVSTDLELAPATDMRYYAERWSCEVDNWYLKECLGLGDFRLRAYEAIAKFIAVVLLAWVYVQCRVCQQRSAGDVPAQVIRQHRDEHAREWLTAACRLALELGAVEPVLARFLPQGSGP
jgi:hypothetical protein